MVRGKLKKEIEKLKYKYDSAGVDEVPMFNAIFKIIDEMINELDKEWNELVFLGRYCDFERLLEKWGLIKELIVNE